jgi:hypothetical protein
MRSLPVLRASATTRWLNCTYFAGHEWPEGESSTAAERGTRVHTTIARVLGAPAEGEAARDDDEVALAAAGVTYAESLFEEAGEGWHKLVERTMVFESPAGTDAIQGTCDLALISPGLDYAVLVDWKTGQRHGVYEDQMLTYGWLLRTLYPTLRKVDVRVVYLATGEEDRKVLHAEDLDQHDQRMMGALSDRSEEPLKATVGHWCQWCPATLQCPKNTGIAAAVERGMDVPNLQKLITQIDNEEEAATAHALLAYANEMLAKIELNMKAFVRTNGGRIRTKDGGEYYRVEATRVTLSNDDRVLSLVEHAGAGDCIKATVAWADVKKKLAKQAAALEILESNLRDMGLMKETRYDTWKVK